MFSTSMAFNDWLLIKNKWAGFYGGGSSTKLYDIYIKICIKQYRKLIFVIFWFVCLFFVCLMVVNAAFTNISVISWRSVLLVGETGGSGEPPSPWSRFELTTPVVIGIDCIGSYKSNYHTITSTTASISWFVKYYWKLKVTHVHSNVRR